MNLIVKSTFLILLASLGFFIIQQSTNVREEPITGVDLIVEHRTLEYLQIASEVIIVPGEQRVLYLRERGDGHRGIFQKELVSGIEGPVIRYIKPGIISHLSVSADGSKMAFSVGGITRWYPTDLYVADTSGRHIRKLTESRFVGEPPDAEQGTPRIIYDRAYTALAISPDGTKVALSINDHVDGERYLALINSDGTGLVKLSERGGFTVRWSLDGRLLFTIYQGKLIEYDIGSHESDDLDMVEGNTLILSPGGDKLYYHRADGLMERNLVTGTTKRIHTMKLEHLAISPSGQQFVGTLDNQLIVLPLRSGSFRRLSLPIGNVLGILSPQEMARTSLPRQPTVKHLQWINEFRLLCVTSNEEMIKIGSLSLGR